MQKNTSKISSDQLTHFVKKEKYLVQILNHNFYPRMCCEDAIRTLFKSDVHVPMKCFCDIPLELLEENMKTYGQYGIGFKKSWGENIGLTPVIYYNENSPYIQHIKKVYNAIIKRLEKSDFGEERSKIVEEICTLKSSFTMYKPIKGKYKRRQEWSAPNPWSNFNVSKFGTNIPVLNHLIPYYSFWFESSRVATGHLRSP